MRQTYSVHRAVSAWRSSGVTSSKSKRTLFTRGVLSGLRRRGPVSRWLKPATVFVGLDRADSHFYTSHGTYAQYVNDNTEAQIPWNELGYELLFDRYML